MIVDHRTYELQPGRLPEFLVPYEKEGLPVQLNHLGRFIGFFTTEVEGIVDCTRRCGPIQHDRPNCRTAVN